jgi:hypothetical protein
MRNTLVNTALIILNNFKSAFLSKENKSSLIITLPISIIIIPFLLIVAVVVGVLTLTFQFFIDIFL